MPEEKDENVVEYYIAGRDRIVAIIHRHPKYGRTIVMLEPTIESSEGFTLMTPDGDKVEEKSFLDFIFSMVPMEQKDA